MKANISFGIKPACFLLESVDRPDIVEQLHAPEGVCPRELLQLRRRDIALGYFFREAAVLLIRFRMDGEEPDVVRLHVVLFDEAMPQRGCRRTKGSLRADLRSEERRVGKECRCRRGGDDCKKNSESEE